MATRLTILGAGPGGYIAAIRGAQLGAEVTIIETDHVGGTCLNRGCIPTKTIKSSAEAMDLAGRLSQYGIVAEGGFSPDMAAIMARKNKVIQTQIKGIETLLKSNGIRMVKGRGTILSPQQVRVETGDGVIDVDGDRLILATGSRVTSLPAFPLDGERIISSDEALLLDTVPEEVLIVGGGVVGTEFAFILNAFGSSVTVVEAMDRILSMPSIDTDTSKVLQREMKKRKIKFYLNKTVVTSEKTENGRVRATLGPSPFLNGVSDKDRAPIEISVDMMLISIGRAYNTENIGLETAGVAVDAAGWIPVNDRMETNVPNIYAVGDVLGPEKIMLAHVATAEGLVAAENCMGRNRTMDYRVVPSGVFTFPEIGSVGISERQADEQGLAFRSDSYNLRALGKAQAMGELAGQVKLISEIGSKKVLGAHIIGAHATELVAEAAMAMKMGATVRDLADTIHLHPSLSEGMMEVAHAALDEGLHSPPLKKTAGKTTEKQA